MVFFQPKLNNYIHTNNKEFWITLNEMQEPIEFFTNPSDDVLVLTSR